LVICTYGRGGYCGRRNGDPCGADIVAKIKSRARDKTKIEIVIIRALRPTMNLRNTAIRRDKLKINRDGAISKRFPGGTL